MGASTYNPDNVPQGNPVPAAEPITEPIETTTTEGGQ